MTNSSLASTASEVPVVRVLFCRPLPERYGRLSTHTALQCSFPDGGCGPPGVEVLVALFADDEGLAFTRRHQVHPRWPFWSTWLVEIGEFAHVVDLQPCLSLAQFTPPARSRWIRSAQARSSGPAGPPDHARWRRRRHSAASSSDDLGFVLITHPFHALSGQRLEVLFVKRRGGDSVFVCSGGVSGHVKGSGA